MSAALRSPGLEDAARVQDAERVEGGLDRPHDVHGVLAALDRQPLAARRPDAVFRRDGPAQVERGPEDLVADTVGELGGRRVVAVEDEVRVEVAVAGMPEGRAANPVGRGDALDRPEELGHSRPGHADILHADRALPLEGPEGEPARLTEPVRLLRIGGPDHLPSACRDTGRLGPVELVGHPRTGCVRFDHEHGRGRHVESQVVPVLDGGDRVAVHELERDGLDAGCRDPGDCLAGGVERIEEREEGASGRRRGPKTERRLGDDPERPLASDEQLGEAVAGDILDVSAAGPDDAPVGHHDLQAEHGIARLAVLDAAQPAGIGAEVAADRAGLVAGRVRCVEEALGGDGGLQVGVDDAGLGHDAEVRGIDLEDPIQPCEGDRQGTLDPGRAARKARAGASRNHRDAISGGEPQQAGNVGRARGKRDGAGQPGFEVGGLVLPVGLAVDLVGEQADRRQLRRRIDKKRGEATVDGSIDHQPMVAAGTSRVTDRQPVPSTIRLMQTRRLAPLLLAVALVACANPSPSQSPAPTAVTSPTPIGTPRPPTVPPTPTPTPAPSSGPTPEPSPTSAIVPGVVGRSTLAMSATYDVDLRVLVATGDIDVRTTITTRNDSGEAVDRVDLNAVAARLGGMQLGAVTVDGRSVTPVVTDQTVEVPLRGLLPDGADVTIGIAYTARLRHDLAGSDWLFSRVDGTLSMYRWIPWVSRAVPFDRPNHGDPFVTPTSPMVRVRVMTDRPMVIASPGAAPAEDGGAWSFAVADVRDVALVMAPDFRLTTGKVGGIPIRVYTRKGGLDASKVLAQAEHALTRIGALVGVDYPWPAFTVVETPGGYGMESPELIWVPKQTTSGNLAYLVHHETAHQWFYGLVGNDQQVQPFADEAMADMVARTVLGLSRASRCARTALDRAITAYSQACYFEDVYIQGGIVLNDIRRAVGTDRFWATIQAYVEANRFGIAGTRQLLEILRAASPADIGPILRSRFPSLYP